MTRERISEIGGFFFDKDGIRKIMKDKKIKLARLAGVLELSYSALQKRLSGEVPFDVVEIVRTCDLLEIDPVTRNKIFFGEG